MIRKRKENAGALLFAIVTAFVLSLVGTTMVLLASNQYRYVNNETERIKCYYMLLAGAEYAIYYSYTFPNDIPRPPFTFQIWPGDPATEVQIEIAADASGTSEYTIEVIKAYGNP